MASDKKIFAVIAADHPVELESKIAAEFPNMNLSVGPGQWLLVGPSSLTTQELSKRLTVSSDDSVSGAIVLSVNSYFGRTPVSVWEWLLAKMGDASAIAV